MAVNLPTPAGVGDVWGNQLNTWLNTANSVINVKLDPYNAKGDGVTDDASAINSALSAAMTAATGSSGGATVVFPPGKYLCKSTVGLTVTTTTIAPIKITGPGMIISDSTLGANPLMKFASSSAGAASWRGLTIKDIALRGNSSHTGDMLQINGNPSGGGMYNFLLDNVVIDGFYGNGINITGFCFQFNLHSCWVQTALSGAVGDTAGDCYLIDGSGGKSTSQGSVVDCFGQGGSRPLHVGAGVPCDLKIIGGTYLAGQNEGIWFNSHAGCIVGAHVEQNGRGAAGTLPGCYFQGYGTVVNVSNAGTDTNQLYGVRVFNDIVASAGAPATVFGANFIDSASGSPNYLRMSSPGTGGTLVTDVPPAYTSVDGTNSTVIRLQDRTDPLKRAATLGSTIPRDLATTNNLASLTSGTLYLFGLYFPAGTKISNISFISGGTAAGTPTHQWFALYDKSLAKLQVTADDTTTAWGANTLKSLALASPYTTTYDGMYYVGYMVAATTVPTLTGQGALQAVTGLGTSLAIQTTSTGLTIPSGAPATAVSAAGLSQRPYADVT